MSANVIGLVKSGSEISYEVKYNAASQEVFVSYSCWTDLGKASTIDEALLKAKDYLANK